MKASTFAKRIINNLTYSDKLLEFEFIILRDLCLYSNPKKAYFYYTSDKEICFGGYFYKYDNVTNFFNGLGVKYESVEYGHNVYSDFLIAKNTFRSIKPFLNEVRKYFEYKHNVIIKFSKYDGSTLSVSSSCNITKQNLIEAIQYIANSNS